MRRTFRLPQPLRPPKELTQLFADPPLALNEKRDEYDGLFDSLAVALDPPNAIGWLFVRDLTDIAWEIRREKNLKRKCIEAAEQSAVAIILTPTRPKELEYGAATPGSAEAEEVAREWASDPKARRRIDKELTDSGYDPMDIIYNALGGNTEIVEFDKRIAFYQLRLITMLTAYGQYNEKLARRVGKIIEGEFAEAAE